VLLQNQKHVGCRSNIFFSQSIKHKRFSSMQEIFSSREGYAALRNAKKQVNKNISILAPAVLAQKYFC